MRKVTFSTILASCFLLIPFTQTYAADAEAGKAKAAMCAGCHGPAGEGMAMPAGVPSNPRLSGQISAYLSSSMMAYKNDTRTDAMMAAISKGLSDEDIANLAAYYSAL